MLPEAPPVELDKKKYQAEMEPLLLKLQRLGRQVYEAKLPVLLLFEGWEGAGKGDVVNHLLSRLDPRGTRVTPFFEPNEEEALRPYFWRYWKCLPNKGQIAVFEQAWYKQLLRRRAERGLKKKGFCEALDGVNSFERLLAEDGTLILKFWLHIGKGEQKRVFKEWKKDKDYAFRLTREAKLQHKNYGRWSQAAEEALRRTNTPVSSWTVVPSEDRRWRRLAVTRAVCAALERALREATSKRKGAGKTPPAAGEPAAAGRRVTAGPNPLDALRLRRVLKPEEYDSRLGELEERLRQLQHRCYLKRIPVVILFEGMDAAGKGGAIRRLVKSLDPRGYTVIPVAAPEGEEKTHHYLWRFWRSLPKAGHWAVFDRTWYGRVLVERVEGFCRPEEWGRSYAEIRSFEAELKDRGAVVVKFWLQIGLKEQLARFKDREALEHKRYKITQEDWRNREKWPLYRDAVADMLLETSTASAPWTLIEADDKRFARLKVLETVVEAVARSL